MQVKCGIAYPEISFWIVRQNAPDTTSLESQIVDLKSQVTNLESQVTSLKSQVTNLESQVANLENDISPIGGIVIFFGAFCALWAQNTGRNAWLWFFLGIFLAPITVIVLLVKNSAERES